MMSIRLRKSDSLLFIVSLKVTWYGVVYFNFILHESLLFIIIPKVTGCGGVLLVGHILHESIQFVVSSKVTLWGAYSYVTLCMSHCYLL